MPDLRAVEVREMKSQSVSCVICKRKFVADEDPHVPGIGALCDECNAKRLGDER